MIEVSSGRTSITLMISSSSRSPQSWRTAVRNAAPGAGSPHPWRGSGRTRRGSSTPRCPNDRRRPRPTRDRRQAPGASRHRGCGPRAHHQDDAVHAIRVGRGERQRYGAALRHTQQMHSTDPSVVHDGLEILDTLVDRWHAHGPVRGARTTLIEVEDSSEEHSIGTLSPAGSPAAGGAETEHPAVWSSWRMPASVASRQPESTNPRHAHMCTPLSGPRAPHGAGARRRHEVGSRSTELAASPYDVGRHATSMRASTGSWPRSSAS